MSERERWIVYPLLFLALGAALKSKFVPDRSVEAERIECADLRAAAITLVDDRQRPRVVLRTLRGTATTAAGPIETESFGQVEILGGENRPLAILGPGLETSRVVCRAVVVIDGQKKPRAVVDTTLWKVGAEEQPRSSGLLSLLGPDDRVIVQLGAGDLKGDGAIEVNNHEGQKAVSLRAGDVGGVVVSHHAEHSADIIAGHLPEGSGVVFGDGKRGHPLSEIVTARQIEQMPKIERKKGAEKPKNADASKPE